MEMMESMSLEGAPSKTAYDRRPALDKACQGRACRIQPVSACPSGVGPCYRLVMGSAGHQTVARPYPAERANRLDATRAPWHALSSARSALS